MRAGREVPGPPTHDLQVQCCLVLHVLDANCHLVGARVGAAGSSDEQDRVRGAVTDAHLVTRQRLPLSGPGHLRPGFALGEDDQPNPEPDSPKVPWTVASGSAAPKRSFNCGFFLGTGKESTYLERDEEVHWLPNFLLDGLAQVSGQLEPWSLCG